MRVLVIAQNTYREASRQPIYYVLVLVFGALILLSPQLTLFTLQDPSGVIRETGLASVTVGCLLVALFSSSACVWLEIERKTALTVLSKPVRREEFLLGKFLGVYWAVFLAAVFLTLLLVLVVWIGEGQKGLGAPSPGTYWKHFRQEYLPQVGRVAAEKLPVLLGGGLLALVQLAILTAVSVTVSVIAPTVVNVCFCMGLYLVGNLSSYVHGLLREASGWLRVPTEALAILLPNFEGLNASWSLTVGRAVPADYLLGAVGYGALYTSAVLLVGLMVFARRELM